jgi:hypothetical protein
MNFYFSKTKLLFIHTKVKEVNIYKRAAVFFHFVSKKPQNKRTNPFLNLTKEDSLPTMTQHGPQLLLRVYHLDPDVFQQPSNTTQRISSGNPMPQTATPVANVARTTRDEEAVTKMKPA